MKFVPVFSLLLFLCAIVHAYSHADDVRDSLQQRDFQLADQGETDASEVVASPHKKSTMLLNKLMNALNKAMEKEQAQSSGHSDPSGMTAIAMPSVARAYQMENQLRGSDDPMFWKCYFNAVSCF